MQVYHLYQFYIILQYPFPLFVAMLGNCPNELHLFCIFLLMSIFHLLINPMILFFYNLILHYLHILHFFHHFHNISAFFPEYLNILIKYLYIFYVLLKNLFSIKNLLQFSLIIYEPY